MFGTQMGALGRARNRVSAASTEDELLKAIRESIHELFVVDAYALWSAEKLRYSPQGDTELSLKEPRTSSNLNEEIATRAYESQDPVLIQDATEDGRFAVENGYRSIVAIPIAGYGVVQVAASEQQAFDEREMAIGDIFCGYVGQQFDKIGVSNANSSSESAAERFLEIANVMMIALDDAGKITLANARAREVLGYEEGDLVGTDWFDVCIPDRLQADIREVFDATMAGKVTPNERYENAVVTADGEERIIEWHNSALRDDEGCVVGTLSSGLDITKRKERERERNLFKQAFEKADTPLTLADPGKDDTPIVYANEAFEEATGYTESEIIGQNCRILQGENTREKKTKELREGIDNGESVTVELRNYRKDGTEFWSRVSVMPVYNDDGNLVRFLGTQEEITERKERERKRKQVIDRVTDGIIELDADWRVTFVSDQAEELVNRTEKQLLGRDMLEVFDEAPGTVFEKRCREALETREPLSFVGYYSGLETWFDVQVYPNDDGGIAIYFRDVTDRKERKKARQKAERRYGALLEMAPDPIVAADATTGEILEANEAAGDFFGYRKDELVGKDGSILYPDADGEGYESFFTAAREDEGIWRSLPDGSPIYVVTESGRQIPVVINVKSVELDGRDILFGIYRDISDQRQYQRRMTKLNDVTRKLFQTETKEEIQQRTVQTLADLLDVSTVGFYSLDKTQWEFRPVTATTPTNSDEQDDKLPVFEPGVGVEWRAFTNGQTAAVNDLRTQETEYDFDREIRSELVVPIADRGALIAGDPRPDLFNDWTVKLVETLGATTEAALDRAEREKKIRDQHEKLREVESINEQIRDITHTIVQADTRAELEQSVCERLTEADAIEFAWIGRVNFEDKAVIPKAQAGMGSDYLDSVSLTLDSSEDPEPSVEALQSRDARGSSNIATNIQHGDWRSTAIERGFRSILSVPLIYREGLYGALTVYSRTTSGFPDTLKSVLQEFCDLIAHASAAIEQREALHTMQTKELVFETRSEAVPFCRMAAVLNCEVELERVVSKTGESTLAFFSVANGTPEELVKDAERLDGIEGARLIERPSSTFIQVRITEPCIGSVLSNRSLVLQQLVADSTRCRLTVEVPEAFTTRQAVNIVTSHYENAQLIAKRESDTSDSRDGSLNTALEDLTPRQREVVETAYRSGYFASPRRTSGKELAEIFDFSNSTFHEHIRKAEQTLFENLLEETNGSLVTQA